MDEDLWDVVIDCYISEGGVLEGHEAESSRRPTWGPRFGLLGVRISYYNIDRHGNHKSVDPLILREILVTITEGRKGLSFAAEARKQERKMNMMGLIGIYAMQTPMIPHAS